MKRLAYVPDISVSYKMQWHLPFHKIMESKAAFKYEDESISVGGLWMDMSERVFIDELAVVNLLLLILYIQLYYAYIIIYTYIRLNMYI